MCVRVISGSARGKKLISPPDDRVRPTLDRVKESIFNMIAFSVPGAKVLDLFAGSGALGIEALSRGAESAVFVDKSRDSLLVAEENLKITSLSGRAECINCEFDNFLKSCTKSFDLIFLDPPYADGLLDEALRLIFEKKLLNNGGYIICESDGKPEFVPDETLFSVHRLKHYGRVQIILLTNV
ncbi:MAG: 16S rRNA (guanine(966)-N(2))-methyltransferase RsmD [Ruminococcaceae bacterium]|nr:16S rRNA (guanine(966)-N(2))-methyltransferase RsmD [Oscillospiraceae bacterium]